jgi:hypothetical protein
MISQRPRFERLTLPNFPSKCGRKGRVEGRNQEELGCGYVKLATKE